MDKNNPRSQTGIEVTGKVSRDEETQVRRRSSVELYVHFVWTVKYRATRLSPDYERPLYRCMVSKAGEMGCSVIAIGGLPDHIHLLVRMPGKISPSLFVRAIKTAATHLFNSMKPEGTEPFHWQDGYGCFSLWRTQIEKVADYVHQQKERHAQNRIWPELEKFEEIVPAIPEKASTPPSID